MSIAVVIVDDQQLIRAGFRMICEAQPDIVVVGEASDGREALEVVRATKPDVVLMDIRMPVMDGIETTRQLPDQPVLVLTTFHEDDYVFEALRAGARGFLLKDAPPSELVAAIRAIHCGDSPMSPAVVHSLIERLMPHIAAAPPTVQARARLDVLTDREQEILLRIATGMTNAEIAADLVVGESTVKTHVSHVLTKLGVRDRIHAVIAAYDAGLVVPTRLADT